MTTLDTHEDCNDASCRCHLTQDEVRNEEACDELERIEAECEAYHAECDAHVDMEIAWLRSTCQR